MLKGMRVLFVIWIISSFKCLYAKTINYLKLKNLRSQHYFQSHFGGSTKLGINSSKRVFELMEALNSEDLSQISNEVDKAYNEPFRTTFNLNQIIRYKKFSYGVDIYNSTLAELNNPVFPEIDIFNVRSNTIWMASEFHYKSIFFVPKISVSQRWYVDQKFTLEDIITNNLNIDFQSSNQLETLYFDLLIRKNIEDIETSIELTGLEITNNDKFKYYQIEITGLKMINKYLKLGSSFTPLYYGNYELTDSINLELELIMNKYLSLDFSISSLEKKLMFSAEHGNIDISLGYESSRVSIFNNTYSDNIFMNLIIRY